MPDRPFLSLPLSQNHKSGSTCVACFLREDSLCLSWLGDSQALLLRGVPGLNVYPLAVGESGAGGPEGGEEKPDQEGREKGEEEKAKTDVASTTTTTPTTNGENTPNGHGEEQVREW